MPILVDMADISFMLIVVYLQAVRITTCGPSFTCAATQDLAQRYLEGIASTRQPYHYTTQADIFVTCYHKLQTHYPDKLYGKVIRANYQRKTQMVS